MKFLIIATIILPIVLLALLIGRRNPAPPEPRRRLIVASIMGILAAILAELLALPFPQLDGISFFDVAIEAFCQDAIPQECAKLLALFLLANNYSYFDKPFNAVIYSVCIAMGFTVFQNLFVFISSFDHWTDTDALQTILSIPGNYLFALIMGAFFSLAWVDPKLRIRNAILSLAIPIAAHGLYSIIEFQTFAAEIFAIVVYVAFIFLYRKPRLAVERLVSRQIEHDIKDCDL